MNKTVLHWSYRDFKHVPIDLIYYDENLEEVYLKENFITKIPLWLFQLTNLKFIHLSGNCIDEIPEEIYLMENLEFLDISNNCVEKIPDRIGDLKKLERLNLNGNKLEKIPNSIGRLKQLENLNLSENPLAQIPIEISECSRLSELSLNGLTNLFYISERIANMKTLQTFCADRCGLLYLPAALTKFVTHVRVFNNTSITYIPMIYEKYFVTFYQPVQKIKSQHLNPSSLLLIKEKESDTTHLLPIGVRNVFKIKPHVDCKITLYDHALHSLNYLNIIYPVYKCSELLDNLPLASMRDHIKNGPISKCNYCYRFLYTTFYIEVVKRRNSTSKSIFICSFCSVYCGTHWWGENKPKYYELPWEICTE